MPVQKQVGSTLTVDHMIPSSSADPPPISSRGSGRSTDHSPIRAVVRRRAERDRKKQRRYDHGAASNVDAIQDGGGPSINPASAFCILRRRRA